MRYLMLGIGLVMIVLVGTALITLILLPFPDHLQPKQTAVLPAKTPDAPLQSSDETPVSPPVPYEPEPTRAKLELPVAAQLPLIQRPEPVRQQPPAAALQPAPSLQTPQPGLAPGNRLSLTEEQRGRLREVLLTHNVMQAEAPATPLKVGGTIPEEIVLSPLPIELADFVPSYSRYSYVIAQDRIVIVRNDQREIEALIPF
jgi:hypothetical protein